VSRSELLREPEEKTAPDLAYLQFRHSQFPMSHQDGPVLGQPITIGDSSINTVDFSKHWQRLKNKLVRKPGKSFVNGQVPFNKPPHRITEGPEESDVEHEDSESFLEGKSKMSKFHLFIAKSKNVSKNIRSRAQTHTSQSGNSDSEDGVKLSFLKLNREKWRAKRTNIIKSVPIDCMKQWKENCWREQNRFSKLSAMPHIVSLKGETIPWAQRIFQDLQRSSILNICGDVNEIFEFPSFASAEDRETLVKTCMKFLNTALDDLISEKCPSLEVEGRSALATKAVNQALISICQDFINDPYFKILKSACEQYSLTPSGSNIPIQMGKFIPGVTISVESPKLNCHVCRTFKAMKIDDVEAQVSEFAFGFKRTYSIDILGGPPKILPPTWLAKNEDKMMEFYSPSIPKSPFRADRLTRTPVAEDEKLHRSIFDSPPNVD